MFVRNHHHPILHEVFQISNALLFQGTFYYCWLAVMAARARFLERVCCALTTNHSLRGKHFSSRVVDNGARGPWTRQRLANSVVGLARAVVRRDRSNPRENLSSISLCGCNPCVCGACTEFKQSSADCLGVEWWRINKIIDNFSIACGCCCYQVTKWEHGVWECGSPKNYRFIGKFDFYTFMIFNKCKLMDIWLTGITAKRFKMDSANR